MDQAAFDEALAAFLARVDALIAAFEAAQAPAVADLSAEGQQVADAQAKIDAALPPSA